MQCFGFNSGRSRPDTFSDDNRCTPPLYFDSRESSDQEKAFPTLLVNDQQTQNMSFETFLSKIKNKPRETPDLQFTENDDFNIFSEGEDVAIPPCPGTFTATAPKSVRQPLLTLEPSGSSDKLSKPQTAMESSSANFVTEIPKQPKSVSPMAERKMSHQTTISRQSADDTTLQPLSDFLDAMFQSKKPSRRLSLTPAESTILKSIIKRKYSNAAEFLTFSNASLSDLLTRLQETTSNKRPEENYKFIFKRCLKHMKEKFKQDHPAIAKRKDLDKCFNEYYFRQVSESQKISIDNFCHPKNSKSKNKTGPKTINNTYIQNICKSKTFKKDFSEYLDKALLEEYKASIKLKIKNLIVRWTKDLRASENKDEIVDGICNYIEKNKKCKLPWSVKEVSEAIRAVNGLFEVATMKTSERHN